MKNWSDTALGKVLRFYNGKAPILVENGKYPVYGSNGLIGRSASFKHENSLIIGRVGAYCGSINLERGKYWATDNTIVADVNDDYELGFIYYLLKALPLNSMAGGSAQPLVNQTILSRITANLPPKGIQQKVAAILSAYDELIENNKRRIALLEKMAEEIYREWFVRLRLPGHEKVKLIKGVPDGWKVEELRAVAIESSRSTRPGSHLAERFYLPLDLLTSKQMLPSGHLDYTEAQSSLVTFEKGDILFGAMRPYLHKVAIAPFPGITRTTCFVIRPKAPQAWSWLFLTLFQPCSVDFATMICNGSDRPYTVWNKGMERMKVFRPDDGLLAKFEETVRPVLDSITSMYFVQLKLINCRDMLLPRLISGKLSVENLDIQFPPGMAEKLKAEPTAGAHA